MSKSKETEKDLYDLINDHLIESGYSPDGPATPIDEVVRPPKRERGESILDIAKPEQPGGLK